MNSHEIGYSGPVPNRPATHPADAALQAFRSVVSVVAVVVLVVALLVVGVYAVVFMDLMPQMQ